MSLRTKLVLIFTLLVVGAVGGVTWAVSTTTRRAFERLDSQRREALVAQFRREFERRGEEVAHRVAGIADLESTLRMAIDLNRPRADVSLYVDDARGLARAHQLDFLDLVGNDGTIISSAAWPARFGYKNDWVTQPQDWKSRGPFLERQELPDGVALLLLAVSDVRVGDRNLYVVGGERLDKEFLASLVLPAGMRALLYRNLDRSFSAQDLIGVAGPVEQAEKLAPLVGEVQNQPRDWSATISWSPEPASAEAFHAIPLLGREGQLLGVLLVGSSQRELVTLENFIRAAAVLAVGVAILLGLMLNSWAAARVTHPVEKLAAGAREVAGGNWETTVEIHSRDEIGQLAHAFNQMTAQLVEQRDRAVQAERVAAWRELARRLAHELKNPLFPLQITVENLRRAREQNPDQFDEVFRESTATLLAELENLRKIVGRFSDFAKMPAPQPQPVNLNELVRDVVHLFEAQFGAVGRPPITPELYFDEKLVPVEADPDLLRKALENLVLNAMDAMPAGGTLTIRTRREGGDVILEVSDTGAGLTREECERLFTPYYTTKQHGTGLGLAIVQSVVSDHGGKISVESEPDRGTTFRIAFPEGSPARAAVAAANQHA